MLTSESIRHALQEILPENYVVTILEDTSDTVRFAVNGFTFSVINTQLPKAYLKYEQLVDWIVRRVDDD